MKVNIQKLQAGGYVTYQPLPIVPPQQAQAPQQQSQQQEEDSGYLDKGILDKMLGQGITTDVMQYSQQVQQAYQQYQTMTDLQRNSYKGRQIRNMLKGDLGQLNALIRAKTTFDDSIKNAKSNDALDEYAVTNQGMVVRNNETGKIDTVSFGQYAADNNAGDKKKYTALTNSQLAEQREYNRDLINNSAVFNVLNFGKGMTKVQEEVYKIVGTIGKSSTTVANGTFSSGDSQDVKELMQAARAGAFKIKSGESAETNTPQIHAAKQALWLNLSENSKAVLRARAATMTGDPSKVEGKAQDLMGSLLDPHTTVSTSKTYDETLTKGGKAASQSEKMANLGPYGMAYSGGSNTIQLSQIGPQGVRIDGFANALPTDAYTTKDNTRTTLRNAGKLNNISYLSQAFVGNGDKVNPDLTVITGDAYVTELPFTIDENNNYKIDEEGAKQYATYKKTLQEQNIQEGSPQALKLQEELGVRNLQLRKFVVAEASSYDKDFFSSRDKNYYNEVTDGAEKKMVHDIVDPNNDITQHAHFWHNDVHKHLIFIPTKDLSSFNNTDGHEARVPESVYEIAKGYNTGAGGMNVARGTNLYNPNTASTLNYTTDYLNK